MSRLLLVEDEEHLAEGLAFNLRNSGYDVEIAGTGEEALDAARRKAFDLILLDVMLPGIDGLEVARRLRRDGQTQPILMVSARGRTADAITGIESGADDYIAKPYDLDEVLARIRGALRRQVWGRNAAPAEEVTTLAYGRWQIDFQRYLAGTSEGDEVSLSPKELGMLKLFASRPGEVISRDELVDRVWGQPASVEIRTVDNFVRRLRQTFEDDPSQPRHIVSVRGVGYRFDP